MANYYRILSAYSDDGEGLSVPVPWNLDSVDDLSVVIVGDSGKPQEIDYWNWDSQLKQIEIPNSQNFKVWSAYVSRKEDAVALFQLIESHEINAQNILEQFQKISRILESLQENEKTFLSSPDYMGGLLPNASHRASKFVSFDEEGKPVCDFPTETFDDAVGFMEKAVGEAEEAFGENVTAKTAEFNSNAASKKSEIEALVDTADGYKTAAAESAGAAAGSASAAAQSETNAASSASSAQASATAAAQSKANALASKNAAEAAAQIAQETDVGGLMLSKLGAGQLYFNGGKLSVANWTSVVIPLPFSLAIEYEVESWEGISYEYNNEFSFFNCTNADWNVPGYPIYGFRLTKSGGSQLGFTLGGCGGEGMGSSRGWGGNIPLPTGRHTVAIAIPAPDADGNSPAAIPVYIDGSMAGNLVASVGKHNASVSFQRPLVINERGVYAGGATSNEFEIALSRISIFNFDMSAEGAPYTVADYAAGKLVPPALYGPAAAQRAILALEDYTIAVGATRYVPDVSGNAYDATVVESGSGDTAGAGTVKGSRDTAIKRLCDLINANNQSA